MAQLVEWLLSTPQIRSSNLVTANRYFTYNCVETTKIKEKEAVEDGHLEKMILFTIVLKVRKQKKKRPWKLVI